MANEPGVTGVPEARDDDPEEVADKLSIAAAMWARGDRADALNWLRRAAESASDAEQDMRALELAKAASQLSAAVESPSAVMPAAVMPAATPAATAPSTSMPAARPATGTPPAKASVSPPGRAPAAASSLPKKPSPSRPPGGKLPPLPPLRPLGSAPAAPPKQPSTRLNSIVTSTTGVVSSSGTITRDEPPPPAAADPAKPMPWDEPMRGDDEDEATHQIAVPDNPMPALDPDTTATREIAVMANQPAREEPPPISTNEQAAPMTDGEISLAIGVRVRVVQDAEGVRVYPEAERYDGVLAILLPVDGSDDLRNLFHRRA